MYRISVTLDTSQFEMSPLNDAAPQNMSSDTAQFDEMLPWDSRTPFGFPVVPLV